MQNNISIIVKVSGICNLNCPYCYYFLSDTEETKTVMEDEILDILINQSSDLGKNVEFIWHGGEPLTAGIEFFNKIVCLQKTIENSKNVKFKNRLQTNATLISQEWIDLFRKGNFGVGVSLDGYEQIHNENRIFHSGKGSYPKVMKGIKALQEANIDFSVLSVVTKQSMNYPREIYNFFVQSGFKRFDFLPLVEIDNSGNLVKGSLNKGDFSAFMNEVFDAWFFNDDSEISIRFLEEVLSVIVGGTPSLCKMSGTCQDYITINYNGDVYPCDNFVGHTELMYGNLNNAKLGEIINTARTISIKKALSQKHDECFQCPANKFCNGGCNKYRYMWNKKFNSSYYFCDDNRNIISHVLKSVTSEHPLLVLQ